MRERVPVNSGTNSQGSREWKPIRLVTAVSTTVGLCIVGDSLLYSILPLEAENLGLTLAQVGLLLSINRLIRLGSNSWIGSIFSRFGPRRPFIVATLLGVGSTMLYGSGWGFAVFFCARALWGIGWSALRHGGYQAVWTGGSVTKGRLMGLFWGLTRLGSAVGVFIGGLFYDQVGYLGTIGVMVLISTVAIPLAWSIRWPPFQQDAGAEEAESRKTAPDAFLSDAILQLQGLLNRWVQILLKPKHRWLVLTGFLDFFLHSVVFATTSLLLRSRLGAEGIESLGLGIATITGALFAVRWLVNLGIAPTLGYLSDQIGQPQTALLLVIGLFGGLLGLSLLGNLWIVLALVLFFICDGGLNIVLNAAASGAAIESEHPHQFVGLFTTAGDAGSALGPLLALSAGGNLGTASVYMVIGSTLTFSVIRYWSLTR